MASSASLLLPCPASTTSSIDRSRVPSANARFSGPRDQSTIVRHSGLCRNSKPSSSSSPSPSSSGPSKLIRQHRRPFPPLASASRNWQRKAFRGGRIVAEADHADGDSPTRSKNEKLQSSAPDPSNSIRKAPNQSMWKLVGRCAACAAVAFVTAWACLPRAAHAVAENSIGASSLGFKVADYLRRSGLPDELVVLIVGSLPVVELRGAIPIGYWLQMEPFKGYALSVIGNMAPVPFIVLYLERILRTVGQKSETGMKFVRWFVDRIRKKTAPIEEFEWLGLCLFVAVPLPGTGAWTGAIAASILGMPFWDAVTANFFGVVLAGLLVTLLVRVGTREAVLVGLAMILSSCFVWTVLRFIQPKKGTSSSASASNSSME